MDIYSKNCFTLMNAFMAVIKNIGIPTAEDKKKGPTIVLIFLGLVIDTELMMVLIPSDKFGNLSSLLKTNVVQKENNS